MGLDFDSEKAKGVSGSSEKMLCVWNQNEQQNLEVSLIAPYVLFVLFCTNRLKKYLIMKLSCGQSPS